MGHLHRPEGRQEVRFLPIACASGQEDRRLPGDPQVRPHPGLLFGRHVGIILVEFGIPGDPDLSACGPQFPDPLRIPLGLHTQAVDVPEHLAVQRVHPIPLDAAEGPIGDASVGGGGGHSQAMGHPEEIGPKFGVHGDEQFRTDGLQDPTHHAGPIEGKKDQGRRVLGPFRGHSPTCFRGGR